jgi:hypothetical protein
MHRVRHMPSHDKAVAGWSGSPTCTTSRACAYVQQAHTFHPGCTAQPLRQLKQLLVSKPCSISSPCVGLADTLKERCLHWRGRGTSGGRGEDSNAVGIEPEVPIILHHKLVGRRACGQVSQR